MAISGFSVMSLVGRGGGVEIVLADEDRWRLLDAGEVQHFVEGAVVRGAIAEKGHADIVAAKLAGAKADARGMSDARADDAIGPEQTDRTVIEMHRAAAAAADAVGTTEQFGHHPSRIGALGQRMAVAAMGRGHPVGRAQMRANAHARRLLSDIQMQETRRFALATGGLRDKLELAQQRHLFEQAKHEGLVRQVGSDPSALPRPLRAVFDMTFLPD